jgi:hypothetical protein
VRTSRSLRCLVSGFLAPLNMVCSLWLGGLT